MEVYMATLTGAVIREQGITFAVVIVKNHVVNCQTTSSNMIQDLIPVFGVPLIALKGESNRKVRSNRRDVASFVANLHPSRIPWRKYTLNG